jgi:ribosomal protein S18 acetylase RimI-like enzyme
MTPSEEQRMVQIRAFRSTDLNDLYRICLATGVGGCDAAALYRDPKLLGQVYAAPYAVLAPRSVLIVDDSAGVAGYIVGAPETRDFETRLEAEWWPALRTLYRDPAGEPRPGWSRDQQISHMIHHPRITASEVVDRYPAHLHINLLPHLRGQGIGRRLMERWLTVVQDMGARGAHLAVGAGNQRAIRFYRACGFHELDRVPRPAPAALWFAIDLAESPSESCARRASG